MEKVFLRKSKRTPSEAGLKGKQIAHTVILRLGCKLEYPGKLYPRDPDVMCWGAVWAFPGHLTLHPNRKKNEEPNKLKKKKSALSLCGREGGIFRN